MTPACWRSAVGSRVANAVSPRGRSTWGDLPATAWWRLSDVPCTRHDPEVFFPDEAREADREAAVRWAQAICRPCASRDACLELALVIAPDSGVWAGTTPADRRRIA